MNLKMILVIIFGPCSTKTAVSQPHICAEPCQGLGFTWRNHGGLQKGVGFGVSILLFGMLLLLLLLLFFLLTGDKGTCYIRIIKGLHSLTPY